MKADYQWDWEIHQFGFLPLTHPPPLPCLPLQPHTLLNNLPPAQQTSALCFSGLSPIRSPPRCWTFFKERNTEAEPLHLPSEPLSASVNMIWPSVVICLSAATMCLGRGGGALSRFFLALQHYGHPGFSQLHNFRHKTFHPHRLMSVSDSQHSPPPPHLFLLLLLLHELLSGLLCSGFIFFPYIVPVSAGFHTTQLPWVSGCCCCLPNTTNSSPQGRSWRALTEIYRSK